MQRSVAVLLYPGCIFFEIALAAEVLRSRFAVQYYTPGSEAHLASNGASLAANGGYADLAEASPAAVLVPGGDPRSILVPRNLAAKALTAQAQRGALIAGICAGNLVIAAAGLLRGRRGTHNYTAEHAPAEKVAATAAYWQGMQFVRADLVQDGRIVTAQPWAYRRYAAVLGKELGVLNTAEADALEHYADRRTGRDA